MKENKLIKVGILFTSPAENRYTDVRTGSLGWPKTRSKEDIQLPLRTENETFYLQLASLI